MSSIRVKKQHRPLPSKYELQQDLWIAIIFFHVRYMYLVASEKEYK